MPAYVEALLCGAAIALAPLPAAAADAIGLDYHAPEQCPKRPDFVAAVQARGGELAAEPSPDVSRVMMVSIVAEGTGFDGAFHIRDARGATDERRVHGPSCDEVVDAMAVVAAIALRPEGQVAPALASCGRAF